MSESLVTETHLPATALVAGIHEPGFALLHTDRVMDCFELIFVQEGVLAIAESDRQFFIQPGQTLLLFPGRRHRGTHACAPEMWFFWICFRTPPAPPSPRLLPPRPDSPDKPEFLAGEWPGVATRSARHAMNIPQVIRPTRPERLVELFRQFLRDQKSGTLRPQTADLFLAMMFDQIMAPPAPEYSSPAQVLAHRAAGYIEKNLSHSPSLGPARIAESLNCNPDYLGRVFRRTFGRTLVNHIQHRRIEKACALLQSGRKSVEQIASDCGYADLRYFRRVFKRHTGMPPGLFRR